VPARALDETFLALPLSALTDAALTRAVDLGCEHAWFGEDDAALEGVVDREALRPLLAQLPARERRIIALRFGRGLSQSQIAAEIGISQMHVSRLLARTLERLRDSLDHSTLRS
jgi:RNA polymerase sigma factor (sigma-70 family)